CLASVKGFAKAAHPLWHREIAHAHLAKIVVEVTAERIKEPLPNGALGAVDLLLTVLPHNRADLGEHEHEMQHDEVKATFERVRHPVARVKCRLARLRHDRAIEVADVRRWGLRSK